MCREPNGKNACAEMYVCVCVCVQNVLYVRLILQISELTSHLTSLLHKTKLDPREMWSSEPENNTASSNHRGALKHSTEWPDKQWCVVTACGGSSAERMGRTRTGLRLETSDRVKP